MPFPGSEGRSGQGGSIARFDSKAPSAELSAKIENGQDQILYVSGASIFGLSHHHKHPVIHVR